MAEKTFAMLRDKAANGESFLIIGRCGDQVLKGNPNMLSIFICGNQQAKVGRVMEKKGLSAEDAIEEIKEVTAPESPTTTTTARRSGATPAATT